MLVISTENWSILAKFAKKNPAKSAVFYWLFLSEVSPRNFLWNRPIFLRICPWKSFENWLFSAKIPRNRPIFLRILTFLPRKSREIGRFFREFWLFSRENPAKSADFSANLPLKIPRNFAFFSAKYQKPCYILVCSTAVLCFIICSVLNLSSTFNSKGILFENGTRVNQSKSSLKI